MACVTATLWHPIRLAEDLATLDHLSGGRLEVGFGRGGRTAETLPFHANADPRNEAASRELFAEVIDIVVGAWTNDFFSHQGPNYTIPPRGLPHHPFHTAEEPYLVDGEVTKLYVAPKPYQKPHPPLWIMVSSENSARFAAERGINAMAAGTANNILQGYIQLYPQVRSELEGRQLTMGEGWAISRPVHVASTMEEARRNFETYAVRQRSYQAQNRGVEAYIQGMYGGAKAKPGTRPLITWELLLECDILAGPPDHVIEQIQELNEVCGINYLNCFMDAGGVPHEKVMRSIELMGTRVMPFFEKAK